LTAAGTAADFGTEVGTAVWASGTRTLSSVSGLTIDANVTAWQGTAANVVGANSLPAVAVQTFYDSGNDRDVAVTTTTATAVSIQLVNNIDAAVSTRAAAATALSTAQWTNTLATNLGTTNTLAAVYLDAPVSSVTTAVNAVGAQVDVVGGLVADVPTNAELATALGTADDAVLAAVAAVSTKVDTVDDFLDTEVAAIKAKTDQLTFTVANQLDANVESINGTTVLGAGTSGNKWRG
jgi:hypothetical protein